MCDQCPGRVSTLTCDQCPKKICEDCVVNCRTCFLQICHDHCHYCRCCKDYWCINHDFPVECMHCNSPVSSMCTRGDRCNICD